MFGYYNGASGGLAEFLGGSAVGGALNGIMGNLGGGDPFTDTVRRRQREIQKMVEEQHYQMQMLNNMRERAFGSPTVNVKVEAPKPDIDKMPLLQYLRLRKNEWLQGVTI